MCCLKTAFLVCDSYVPPTGHYQVTTLLRDAGIHSVTIQVEKEEYFQHLSGLGAYMDQNFSNLSLNPFNTTHLVKAV